MNPRSAVPPRRCSSAVANVSLKLIELDQSIERHEPSSLVLCKDNKAVHSSGLSGRPRRGLGRPSIGSTTTVASDSKSLSKHNGCQSVATTTSMHSEASSIRTSSGHGLNRDTLKLKLSQKGAKTILPRVIRNGRYRRSLMGELGNNKDAVAVDCDDDSKSMVEETRSDATSDHLSGNIAEFPEDTQRSDNDMIPLTSIRVVSNSDNTDDMGLSLGNESLCGRHCDDDDDDRSFYEDDGDYNHWDDAVDVDGTVTDAYRQQNVPDNRRESICQHPRPNASYHRPRSLPPQRSQRSQRQLVEVFPGVEVPLRTTQEIVNAVKNDFYTPITCFSCSTDMFCIADTSFFLCCDPGCQSINPILEEGSDGIRDRHGLGLGFSIESLFQMQTEVLKDRNSGR